MYDKDTQLLAETYKQIHNESFDFSGWIPDLGIMKHLYWIGSEAVSGVMGAVIARYLGQFLQHLAQKYDKQREAANTNVQTAIGDVGYSEFERRRNEEEAKNQQPQTPNTPAKRVVLKRHGETVPVNMPNKNVAGQTPPTAEMPLQKQVELRMKIAEKLQAMYPMKDRTFWNKVLEKAAADMQTKWGMIAGGVLMALLRALIVHHP